MILLTSLPQNLRDFVISVSNSGITRNPLLAICAAKAIADNIPITNRLNEDISLYFNRMLSLQAMKTISNINEYIIMDTNKVHSLAKSFYIYRYKIAVNPFPVLLSEDTAIYDFFGITSVLSIEELELIKADRIKAMSYYNNLLAIVIELDKLSTGK